MGYKGYSYGRDSLFKGRFFRTTRGHVLLSLVLSSVLFYPLFIFSIALFCLNQGYVNGKILINPLILNNKLSYVYTIIKLYKLLSDKEHLLQGESNEISIRHM